jgi:arylsulfatase A-like enzyme
MSDTRRQFLRSVAGGAATPLLPAQSKRRPNVLFILVDEWRAQATGYNGDPNVRAPVLDRFSGECVGFDNAISSLPVCCPYRASLLTGQYPLTNGVYVNDIPLRPNATTLGEAFAKAGYRTGYIGKWHLYGSPKGENERRLDYIPPDKRFGFDYWKVCECTHNYNKSLYYEGNDPTPKYWPGYDAFPQSDDACAFMEKHAQSPDPFFLVLSLGPPHFPLNTAPAKHRALFADGEIRFRDNVPQDRRAEAATMLRGYYAHMAALDECLERLLASLDRARIADDTIVVFTSDHGDMMLSHGLTTKLHPWEESIRVPFLLRYPRKFGRKQRRLTTPLNAPDIFPTLAGLAGVPIPGAVEGSDLSGIIGGKAEAGGDPGTLLNLPVPITEARRHGFAEYRGVRTRRYTYVRSIRGPWLLYDNQADPYQMRNLIAKPEAKQLQSRLDGELDGLLKRRKDDFLPAGEYIRRAGVGHYREVNTKIGRHPSPWGDWDSTLAQP